MTKTYNRFEQTWQWISGGIFILCKYNKPLTHLKCKVKLALPLYSLLQTFKLHLKDHFPYLTHDMI